MSFDSSVITDVRPPARVVGAGGVLIQWSSSAPAGTEYQVYVARRLAWHGRSRRAIVPTPPDSARIDVGAVGPGEGSADFSGSLPGAYDDRARLTWLGGTHLGAGIVGFNVYASATPGGAVDYARRVARVAAYGAGGVTDGFGMGGFGQGVWGRAAASYAWTSGPLAAGTWTFGVRPFDSAGNESAGSEVEVAIVAPPGPPAPFAGGGRLRLTYDAGTHEATLAWHASPG